MTVLKQSNLHVIKVNLTEHRFSFIFFKDFCGRSFFPIFLKEWNKLLLCLYKYLLSLIMDFPVSRQLGRRSILNFKGSLKKFKIKSQRLYEENKIISFAYIDMKFNIKPN